MRPPDLAGIRARVLLIRGRYDRIVPFEVSLAILNRIADSRLVLLNNCGHWPPFLRRKDSAVAQGREVTGADVQTWVGGAIQKTPNSMLPIAAKNTAKWIESQNLSGWLAMSRWLMPSGLQFCMRDSIASVNRNSIFAKRNVPAAYRMCCSATCGRTLSGRASAIAAHAASLRVAVSPRQCGGSKLVSFQTFGPGDISTAIASRTVGDKR